MYEPASSTTALDSFQIQGPAHPCLLQKRRCHPGTLTSAHAAYDLGATIPLCHASRSGTAQGQTSEDTAHGHFRRGASLMLLGSVGPAAIGESGLGSCLSQHSPRVCVCTS